MRAWMLFLVLSGGDPAAAQTPPVLSAKEAPPASPATMFETALADLMDEVNGAAVLRRPFTRYFSSHSIPDEQQEDFYYALTFACNSLSMRRMITHPIKVADYLYRIDLADYGWDRSSRQERIELAKKAEVSFGFGDDKTLATELLDPWETLAKRDPYFRTTVKTGDTLSRGWINPLSWDQAAKQSNSAQFIVRGDWFLAQIGFDRPRGVYSDFLMLPKDEANLYKLFGVNETFLGDSNLMQGGAVVFSSVAQHNRSLELMPGLLGRDERFIWRTYDFNKSAGADSILRSFAGVQKLNHAAREIIGTLPNGGHWYYLANGAGAQQAFAPPDIAQDKEDPYDAIVYSMYKCVRCHGPNNGLNPFEDQIRALALHPKVGLAVLTKDINDDKIRSRLEDYYLSDLAPLLSRQQQSYERFMEEIYYPDEKQRKAYLAGKATGDILGPSQRNATNFVRFINNFLHSQVTRGQAAREMGFPIDQIDTILVRGDQAELLTLLAEKPVTREQFESVFAAGMRGGTYPWESVDVTPLPYDKAPPEAPAPETQPPQTTGVGGQRKKDVEEKPTQIFQGNTESP